MDKVKWFSGGNDRSEQAVALISELLTELNRELKNDPLKQVLNSYVIELEEKQFSVPFILSWMNLEISNTLKREEILLTTAQSEKMKELISLLTIRYSY